MDRFSDMTLFLAIVDAGGLAAGGRKLGLSPARVSERMQAMEAQVGVRLLTRTTRSINLTEEGRLYVEAARGILADVDDLDTRLRDGGKRISGPIRVAAPFDLGRNRIAPLLDAFMAAHPAISVELALSDAFGNLVDEGIDIAVRYGRLEDSGLVVRRLADSRRIVCASPDYVAQHGEPAAPHDLTGHNCLLMRFGLHRDDRWPFMAEGRETIVHVSGNRTANDGDLIRRWALAGYGVAFKSIWDVADDLSSGRLVELLGNHAPPSSGVQIVYPAARNLPRRVRAVIDYLALNFTSQPLS